MRSARKSLKSFTDAQHDKLARAQQSLTVLPTKPILNGSDLTHLAHNGGIGPMRWKESGSLTGWAAQVLKRHLEPVDEATADQSRDRNPEFVFQQTALCDYARAYYLNEFARAVTEEVQAADKGGLRSALRLSIDQMNTVREMALFGQSPIYGELVRDMRHVITTSVKHRLTTQPDSVDPDDAAVVVSQASTQRALTFDPSRGLV